MMSLKQLLKYLKVCSGGLVINDLIVQVVGVSFLKGSVMCFGFFDISFNDSHNEFEYA